MWNSSSQYTVCNQMLMYNFHVNYVHTVYSLKDPTHDAIGMQTHAFQMHSCGLSTCITLSAIVAVVQAALAASGEPAF